MHEGKGIQYTKLYGNLKCRACPEYSVVYTQAHNLTKHLQDGTVHDVEELLGWGYEMWRVRQDEDSTQRIMLWLELNRFIKIKPPKAKKRMNKPMKDEKDDGDYIPEK